MFNPFPMWFIFLVILPFQLLVFITYLPYKLFRAVGIELIWYKKSHAFVWEHLQQLLLDPPNYFKHTKSINKQILEDINKYIK